MADTYADFLATPALMRKVLEEHGFRGPFQSATVGIAWKTEFKGGNNPVAEEEALGRLEEVKTAVDAHDDLVWIKSFEEHGRGTQKITVVYRAVGRGNPAVRYVQEELDRRQAIQDTRVKCITRGCSELLKPSELVCPLCKTEQVRRQPIDMYSGLPLPVSRPATKPGPKPVTHMRALEVPPGGEIPVLLEALQAAKQRGDGAEAKKIRVRLRKLNYFISGKK